MIVEIAPERGGVSGRTRDDNKNRIIGSRQTRNSAWEIGLRIKEDNILPILWDRIRYLSSGYVNDSLLE